MKKKERHVVRFEDVRDRIVEVRGQKVILDFAVAELYGVETKRINEAVKNNPRKFPEGWVFELDKEESADLRWKYSTTNIADNQLGKTLKSNNSTLEDDLQSKDLTTKPGKGHYSKHNFKATSLSSSSTARQKRHYSRLTSAATPYPMRPTRNQHIRLVPASQARQAL